MNRLAGIMLALLWLTGCAASGPDRPALLTADEISGKAVVTGSISRPADRDGFDSYSIDIVAPALETAARLRVAESSAPIGENFPTDMMINGRQAYVFVRLVDPGTWYLARHAVNITSAFTTYTFGRGGRLSGPIRLEAGDIVYLGDHAFHPRHDDEFFLWQDLEAPDYRISDEFDATLELLRTLYPALDGGQPDWNEMRKEIPVIDEENSRPIEESDVWINPLNWWPGG